MQRHTYSVRHVTVCFYNTLVHLTLFAYFMFFIFVFFFLFVSFLSFNHFLVFKHLLLLLFLLLVTVFPHFFFSPSSYPSLICFFSSSIRNLHSHIFIFVYLDLHTFPDRYWFNYVYDLNDVCTIGRKIKSCTTQIDEKIMQVP